MFGITASQLQALPGEFFPVFDICHYLLAALAVRGDAGATRRKQHPLATWMATMSASFAGSLLANPLMGKPILAAVSNEQQVLLASLVWWAVFYSPGDLAYTLAKNKVLYIPICVIKEIYRAKKVMGGMADARKVFPDNEMIILMIGALKGNGSGFMKPITRLILGDWSPSKSEILKMSATSKECVAAALLFLSHQLGYLTVLSFDLLYISVVTTFIIIKLSGVLADPIDPFIPVENSVSFLALGGLWDNISESNGDEQQE